jgi:hypothetical protein
VSDRPPSSDLYRPIEEKALAGGYESFDQYEAERKKARLECMDKGEYVCASVCFAPCTKTQHPILQAQDNSLYNPKDYTLHPEI